MASTYLTRTSSSTGNRKTWTLSAWLKRSNTGVKHGIFGTYTDANNRLDFAIDTADKVTMKEKSGGSTVIDFTSKRVFRDTNAWYHIVFKVDTTQASSGDRVKIYVNGTEITEWVDNTQPSQNYDTLMNVTGRSYLIGQTGGNTNYWDGCMSHVHLTDGAAYTPSTFGSTDSATGEWKISTNPTVTYGTNGFFMLKDDASLSDDSGQGNNFTVGGGTITQTEDCPSDVFCTFNVLLPQSNTGVSKGATRFETTSGSGWKSMCGTLGMVKNSGKYYMEFKHLGGSYNGYGIADFKNGGIVDQINQSQTTYPGEAANSYGYLSQGELHYNASQTGTGWDSYTTNDIIGMAVDMENMKLYYHKNGSYLQSGNPSTGANGYSINDPVGAYFPTATVNAGIMCANFGNGSFDGTAISSEGSNASGIGKFEYDVPTGYTALSTKGLNE